MGKGPEAEMNLVGSRSERLKQKPSKSEGPGHEGPWRSRQGEHGGRVTRVPGGQGRGSTEAGTVKGCARGRTADKGAWTRWGQLHTPRDAAHDTSIQAESTGSACRG